MISEWVLTLIGGMGLGSIGATVVNAWLDNKKAIKDRAYAEKREAYLGLLAALHQANVDRTGAGAKMYALALAQASLFGEPEVIKAADLLRSCKPYSEEMGSGVLDLVQAMRRDLGISGKALDGSPF